MVISVPLPLLAEEENQIRRGLVGFMNQNVGTRRAEAVGEQGLGADCMEGSCF